MAEKVVKGYPTVFGNRGACVADHTGPASYVTWTGTSGGQTLNGANKPVNEFGLRGLDMVIPVGISVSGTYYVKAQFLAGNGGAQTQCTLVWYTVSGNAQPSAATNLSAETVRLFVVGG
jgi:hypothetical protein